MNGGTAEDFIDSLNDGPQAVRHRSYVYRFSGLIWHPARETYSVSVEKYRFSKEPWTDFMEIIYRYESPDADDCLDHIEEDVLWDGKSFYELEKALTWIDW